MATRESYLTATRHPCACLLFLLPLLVAYEAGVVWLGGTRPDALRNGADAWLRWGLTQAGLKQTYWMPIFLALWFLVWAWLRRADRPKDLLGALTGMVLESVVFALGLWGLSQGLGRVLDHFHAPSLAVGRQETVSQVVTYVGAGIYEEAVFRLLLFSLLRRTLLAVQAPWLLAVGFGAMASAACFSAAHHVGPFGEPFESAAFLFRLVAGLYFAMLYQFRGFGIAAGTHACYDVLVGVAIG
jgi:hypothetical protein